MIDLTKENISTWSTGRLLDLADDFANPCLTGSEILVRELASRLASLTRWIDMHDAPLDGESIVIHIPSCEGPFGRIAARHVVAHFVTDDGPEPCWVVAAGIAYTDKGLRDAGAMWLPLADAP